MTLGAYTAMIWALRLATVLKFTIAFCVSAAILSAAGIWLAIRRGRGGQKRWWPR